jgi:hypothetical protein
VKTLVVEYFWRISIAFSSQSEEKREQNMRPCY